MKFVAIIISIFIFYMVSVPCVDEVIHIEKSILAKSTPQGNPCSPSEHDACTPFCVCSCCGVVVVIANIYFDSQPIFAFKTVFLSFNKTFTSNFFQSFWQPPKLS